MSEDLRNKLHAKIAAKKAIRTAQSNMPREGYNVLDAVKSLSKDKHEMSFPALKKKYIGLRQDHPQLYELAMKKDLTGPEFDILAKMLDTREQLRNGDIDEAVAKDLVATNVLAHYMPDAVKPPADDTGVTEL
jgi:hypothetical protein